jgi:hypothetical protein
LVQIEAVERLIHQQHGARRQQPERQQKAPPISYGSIIQERIHAGIARARIVGRKSGKPIGRAKIPPAKEAAIRAALQSGSGILKTARERQTGTSVVQHIKASMAAPFSIPQE